MDVCPRRFTDVLSENLDECIGERCAIWDTHLECCGELAVLLVERQIYSVLINIELSLRDLVSSVNKARAAIQSKS